MEPTRITVDEIGERMNRGERFVFVDARNPTAWSQSDIKLPGAIRVPADDVDRHLPEIPRDRSIIPYCT
jgi:rhodanese-related sulfurtransferase